MPPHRASARTPFRNGMAEPPALRDSPPVRPLTDYDAWLLDLDGVVYRGQRAVPGAVPALTAARNLGLPLVYVTNNAARTPAEVAGHLTALGAPAVADDVLTSAQAGAALLAELLRAAGTDQWTVLALGGPGVPHALAEVGLTPLLAADAQLLVEAVGRQRGLQGVSGVLQGYGPLVSWQHLALAAAAVQRGAVWVATNTDMTIPYDGGIAPGNGTLVAAVTAATGVQPPVAGKPNPPIMRQAIDRVRAGRPLVIGDRLDTDIAGAIAVQASSALVLTGVSSLLDAWRAPAALRPRHIVTRLTDLLGPVPDLAASTGPRPSSADSAPARNLVDIASATRAAWDRADAGLPEDSGTSERASALTAATGAEGRGLVEID